MGIGLLGTASAKARKKDYKVKVDPKEPLAEPLPFGLPKDSVQKALPRGFRRRAVKTVNVAGCATPCHMQCVLWKDNRVLIIGSSVREYNGEMIDQFVERRFRDGKGSVDSFIAQIEHAKGYGGVDRLGKGAKEYGIHFKMVPWHDNIVMAMLNLSSHTMWVIVNYLE
jgi:hypothetical protein